LVAGLCPHLEFQILDRKHNVSENGCPQVRGDTSSPEDGNRSSFQNVFYYLESWTMNRNLVCNINLILIECI
jgi:hypothetical protein